MNSTPSATGTAHKAVDERLLEGRADPTEIDNAGETSLHQATWNGYPAAIELVLDKPADPNQKDRTRQTPLHQSTGNASMAAVQLLRHERADLSAQDNDHRELHSIVEEISYHQITKTPIEQESEI